MGLTRWERKEKIAHGDVTKIARKLGCSIAHVSQVLNGSRRSTRVELALARAMGVPVAEAFETEVAEPGERHVTGYLEWDVPGRPPGRREPA